MAGKSWKQEHKAAGHIASPAGKQREMNAAGQLTFPSLLSLEISISGKVLCNDSFHFHLPYLETSPWPRSEASFLEGPDSVKFPIKINDPRGDMT